MKLFGTYAVDFHMPRRLEKESRVSRLELAPDWGQKVHWPIPYPPSATFRISNPRLQPILPMPIIAASVQYGVYDYRIILQ
jgi:hypothetical protein